MGYLKIQNLYRDTTVLLFREVWALEKIHGTSAHIAWADGATRYFAGGGSHEQFVALFDDAAMRERFAALGHPTVTVFGESYGGKQQGMSKTYGAVPRFVVFDVRIGDAWLCVSDAVDVALRLGLEFVYHERGPSDLAWLDEQRDRPSEQSRRNGIGEPKPSEGIVIRPIVELTTSNGQRVIAKHKRAEFRETATQREVDPDRIVVLQGAEAIAREWVTPMRLAHVLDQLPEKGEMKHTSLVCRAMLDDIRAESGGEIAWSKEAERAIGRATADMYKAKVQGVKNP